MHDAPPSEDEMSSPFFSSSTLCCCWVRKLCFSAKTINFYIHLYAMGLFNYQKKFHCNHFFFSQVYYWFAVYKDDKFLMVLVLYELIHLTDHQFSLIDFSFSLTQILLHKHCFILVFFLFWTHQTFKSNNIA